MQLKTKLMMSQLNSWKTVRTARHSSRSH